MGQKEKILDFIRRRFSEDNRWREGNCYWAAWILCEEFKLRIVYEPVEGHFVAEDTTNGVWYDAFGEYTPCHKLFYLSWIRENDIVWYRRLMHECRD